jgi:hypothetical protein
MRFRSSPQFSQANAGIVPHCNLSYPFLCTSHLTIWRSTEWEVDSIVKQSINKQIRIYVKSTIPWILSPCRLVEVYLSFAGICRFLLEGKIVSQIKKREWADDKLSAYFVVTDVSTSNPANINKKTKLNSVAFSSHANYTDRETAACRRS